MNRIAPSLTLSAAAALCGCTSDQAPDAVDLPYHRLPEPASSDGLSRLINADNGLQIRQWVVSGDPNRIAAALMQYRDGQPVGTTTASALRRNGLRFVRMRADQLDALLADLGGALLDVTGWHGQVYEWRQLQQYPIGPGGTAVAVDGRVGRYGPGSLRLLVRSWTVQMEDGPYLNLELLPQFHRRQGPALSRLLGDREAEGEVFASMALEVQLEAGFAYVLTGESPQMLWTPGGAEAVVPEGDLPADSTRPAQPVAAGPPPPLGPGAVAPATVGELLFASRTEPPARSILVFVPKIPARLFPPAQVATDRFPVEDGATDAAAK